MIVTLKAIVHDGKVELAEPATLPEGAKVLVTVPLTSKTDRMIEGEFSLADWQGAGLNVASVGKRGLYTIHESLLREVRHSTHAHRVKPHTIGGHVQGEDTHDSQLHAHS